MFQVNHPYTKTDIYRILHVPRNAQKGAWNTGYREYNNAIYIFANIGVAGRTGHDYDNHWRSGRPGSDLIWYSKTTAKVNQPLIQKMLDPGASVHIFTRNDDRDPFTYNGTGRAINYENSSPIKVTWTFADAPIPRKFKFEGTQEIAEALNDDGRRSIRLLRLRRGQPRLRRNLLKLYKGKCCISGCKIQAVLHACHIDSHAESLNNKSTNALLLRSDIHDLFDLNLIGINPKDFTIAVSKSLRHSEYAEFSGQKLAQRSDDRIPDLEALKRRWKAFRPL